MGRYRPGCGGRALKQQIAIVSWQYVFVITADQILAHLFGDYVVQSDWMANAKTKHSFAAAVHALSYGLCFVLLRPSLAAFAFIVGTHFVIDRWRLARFVVYAKNFLAPRKSSDQTKDGYIIEFGQQWWHPWAECSATGYHKDRPAFMAVWLLILCDNAMHILCNGLAFTYLK